MQRAIIRSLEIIGEASKKISNEFRTKHPEIPWKEMAGLRDVLIHDYFGVDIIIVWDVIENQVPILLIPIKEIIINSQRSSGEQEKFEY